MLFVQSSRTTTAVVLPHSRKTHRPLCLFARRAPSSIVQLSAPILLLAMIWDFGLGCAIPRYRHRGKVENNKAWLLAESGDCGTDKAPYSGHSSFRFSLCSQVELESAMAVNKMYWIEFLWHLVRCK